MAEFIKRDETFDVHMIAVKDLERWADKVDERLDAIEKNIEPKVIFDVEKMRVLGDEIGIISGSYVDEKLYDELEAKHEADCRIISEYDLEIKRLDKQNMELNDTISDLYSKYVSEEKEHLRCEAVIEDKNREIKEHKFHVEKLKADVERWVDRYERLRDMDKKKLFDFKNVENERDHYKGLYSSKCDDYDKLLEKQIKTEKELKHADEVGDDYKLLYDTTCENYDKLEEKYNKLFKDYKLLSESNNNHATDNIELEGKLEVKSCRIAALEEKLRNQRANLTSLQEKYEDAVKMNKAREDVYYANIKLQKTIEAKDREIGLLRAELDKYKTDDECDDRWID